ncbi:MAG: protease modulator HflK [Alphaproteobacteria bacterium]
MPWEETPNEQDVAKMAEDPWGSGSAPRRQTPRKSNASKPVNIESERNRRAGGGGGNGRPPQNNGNEFEDIARNAADQAGSILKRLGSGGVSFVIGLLFILWGATGIYQVGETERAVKTTFGQFAGVGQPGLNWHWPRPIGKAELIDVSQQTLEIGGGVGRNEQLIVTGDKQLVSFPIKIVWQVDAAAPEIYRFAYGNPVNVIKLAGETALRDNIGRTAALDAIGARAGQIRDQIEVDLTALISANDQPLGVRIVRVDAASTPQVPEQVQDSVRAIQQAQATALIRLEEAQQFENAQLNEAQGVAGQVFAQARQDVVRRVNVGLGEANKLRQIYNGYRQSPESTLQRLYEDARRILLSEAQIDATADELRLDQILSNLTSGGSR